ncbi:MAG TPA: SDR family NAD(P)-dependent oxidoreductase [Longimicrobiales bacterium]|nr:SDR family NAD(P)-dependent oxidoreductase [Longimicrobiales bacterium]
MTTMQGRRVLITGASAGIGAACAHRFAAQGAELILWARREERLAEQADALEAQYGCRVHAKVVDVRDRDAVIDAVAALEEADAGPDILVNNAGLAAGFDLVQDGDPDDWDRMIDTNIKGLLYVTRAVLPGMIARGRGHIINIGSLAGHATYPRGNVYSATKFAVRALTEGINMDVLGTPVRVSSISPGLVETEFSVVRFHGDEARAKQVYQGFQPLTGDDVAECVLFVANAPAYMNILDMVIMPTAQRSVHAVDRGAAK